MKKDSIQTEVGSRMDGIESLHRGRLDRMNRESKECLCVCARLRIYVYVCVYNVGHVNRKNKGGNRKGVAR